MINSFEKFFLYGYNEVIEHDGLLYEYKITNKHIKTRALGENSWVDGEYFLYIDLKNATYSLCTSKTVLRRGELTLTLEEYDIKLDEIFDSCGDFNLKEHGLVHYDPYRVSEDALEFHNKIFDEDGNLRTEIYDQLSRSINKSVAYNCTSDALCCYHAYEFSRNTKGNYTTIYYWR